MQIPLLDGLAIKMPRPLKRRICYDYMPVWGCVSIIMMGILGVGTNKFRMNIIGYEV